MKGLILILVVLALSGCLSHWFVDTETRLQVVNSTAFPIADLRIIDPSGEHSAIHWNTDTLVPGEKGRVISRELVGSFSFAISARDSLCGQDSCWRSRDLGQHEVEGGSQQWRIRSSGSKLIIDAR